MAPPRCSHYRYTHSSDGESVAAAQHPMLRCSVVADERGDTALATSRQRGIKQREGKRERGSVETSKNGAGEQGERELHAPVPRVSCPPPRLWAQSAALNSGKDDADTGLWLTQVFGRAV